MNAKELSHSRLGRAVRVFSVVTFAFGVLGVATPVAAQVEARFIRGDCNVDRSVNLADAIHALYRLYEVPGPACEDACDVNDDGLFDLADPISLLTHLFSSGAAPRAPFPGCGVDPTDDALGCDAYGPCPPTGYESPPAMPLAIPLASGPGAVLAPREHPPDPCSPWVYLHSGEFHHQVVDLRIRGRGLDLVWARTYRSRLGQSTTLGHGWQHSYDASIRPVGPDIVVSDGNGRRDLLTLQPDGAYTAPELFREGRIEPDGSFTLTFSDTGVWTFHGFDGSTAAGKIATSQDRNGNTLTYSYDPLGRLIGIRDTLDTPTNPREVTISYNSSGLVESVTDFVGRTVSYAYYQVGEPGGNPGDLKSATTPAVIGTPTGNDFPFGKTTTYTYSIGFSDERLNHNLLTITDPSGQAFLTNEFAATTDSTDLEFDRLVRQRWGLPEDILDYVYAEQTPEPGNGYAVIMAIVNDRVGNVAECLYDADHRLVVRREYPGRADADLPTTETTNRPLNPLRLTDPPVFETRYEWNAAACCTLIETPNLTRIERTYELDLDLGAPWRTRGNLRLLRRVPGPLGGDQFEILESFVHAPGFGSSYGPTFVTVHTDPRGSLTQHSYDANGNRVHTTHRIPSIQDDYDYDGFGRLTRHVHPSDAGGVRREDTWIYYADPTDPRYGYLDTRVVDALGEALTTHHDRDAVGNVTRVTDPRGHDDERIHNQLDQVVLTRSREVSGDIAVRYEADYRYDANDNLLERNLENVNDQGVLQPNTHFTIRYDYEILNRVVRVTREEGPGHSVVTEYDYDANRNRVLTRYGEATGGDDDPLTVGAQPTNTLSILYDERDLPYQIIRAASDPRQSTSQFDYDGNRNLMHRLTGLEENPRLTVVVYDGYDRPVAVTDPMGNVTEAHYDANGNLGGEQSLGIPHPFAVRHSGELLDVPGSAGNVRLAESMRIYDTMDRLTMQEGRFFDLLTQAPIDDGQATTLRAYSDASQLVQVINDNGHATEYGYDSVHRLALVTDARGNTVELGYDENSNAVAVTETEHSDGGTPSKVFVTTLDYDHLDRRIRTTDNLGHVLEWGYDSRNNPTFFSDALRASPSDPGNVVRREYDGLNRLTAVRRQLTDDGTGGGTTLGEIVTFRVWDDSSRLVGQIDANGNSTNYEYDPLQRRLDYIYADGTGESRVYDVHDNVTQVTQATGTLVVDFYDMLDRRVDRTVLPAPGISTDTTYESFRYDGLSRLVIAEDDDSVVTRFYDSLSHRVEEVVNTRATVSTYDGVGNRLTCAYSSGRTIAATYDELERLGTLTDGPDTIATHAYVGPARLERRLYGNGLEAHFNYDGGRRIIETRHEDVTGLNLVDARVYAWDAMDDKVERSDVRPGGPGLTHAYVYDSVHRLRETDVTDGLGLLVRETTYALDEVGNRTEVLGDGCPGLYVMDPTLPEPADHPMNQYTSTPCDDRNYDLQGNLVGRLDPTGTVHAMTYDHRRQLTDVRQNGVAVAHYGYDALGRRVGRDIFGSFPSSTSYAYDGPRVIEEWNGAPAPEASYVYGAGPGARLSMERGGVEYVYHTDDRGNVMALTDPMGAVVERYEYQDYGAPEITGPLGTPRVESWLGNPHLFGGRRYDLETGYYSEDEGAGALAGQGVGSPPFSWTFFADFDHESRGNSRLLTGLGGSHPSWCGVFANSSARLEATFTPAPWVERPWWDIELLDVRTMGVCEDDPLVCEMAWDTVCVSLAEEAVEDPVPRDSAESDGLRPFPSFWRWGEWLRAYLDAWSARPCRVGASSEIVDRDQESNPREVRLDWEITVLLKDEAPGFRPIVTVRNAVVQVGFRWRPTFSPWEEALIESLRGTQRRAPSERWRLTIMTRFFGDELPWRDSLTDVDVSSAAWDDPGPGGRFTRYFDPIAGRFIPRVGPGPWADASLGNASAVAGDNPWSDPVRRE